MPSASQSSASSFRQNISPMVSPMAGMTTLCQGWLSSLVSFRPYFDAPGVGADRRNLLVLAPIAVFESDAGSVAASVGAPLAFRQAALHLPGAQDDEIA